MIIMEKTKDLKGNIIMEISKAFLDQCQRKLATIFAWVGGFAALIYVIKTGSLPLELHTPFLIMYISSFVSWTVGFVLGVISLNLNIKE